MNKGTGRDGKELKDQELGEKDRYIFMEGWKLWVLENLHLLFIFPWGNHSFEENEKLLEGRKKEGEEGQGINWDTSPYGNLLPKAQD